MQLIALTGGIASGKSTIGRHLEQLGAVRIDTDQLARDAVAPGSPGLARIVERFGEGMLGADGALNRPVLGEVVFGDSAALRDLNAIVHPEVRRLGKERIQDAAQANPDAVVVYEIPLLVETGLHLPENGFAWDLIVVADAPEETRIDRMKELRGMTEDDARGRLANQASDEERRAIADVLIDTSSAESRTFEQVDSLWAGLGAQSLARE